MNETEHEEQTALLMELKEQSVVLESSAFCALNDGHYLLGRMPADEADDWSFATDVRTFGFGPVKDSILQGVPTGDRLLWKVEKSDRNAWKRRISVGRATNNDIIIRHHSVSKLHAHFLFGMLAKLRQLSPSAELLLSDVGSSNGSSVAGRRLLEGEVVPVGNGSKILFGDVACLLLNAPELYRTLRSILI